MQHINNLTRDDAAARFDAGVEYTEEEYDND
jgi:hypothetical protein